MICPNCQKDQKVGDQNYGALYTCPSCQAVYFINFDGIPEFGDVSTDSFDSSSSELLDLSISAEAVGGSPAAQDEQVTNYAQLPEFGSIEPLVPSNNLIDPISNDPLSEQQGGFNSISSENLIDNPFEMQNNMSALNSDVEAEPAPEAAPIAPPKPIAKAPPAAKPQTSAARPSASTKSQATSGSFADIAQELSDFGNTDSHLSGLSYDLIVSGIDTQETKSLFKEAIEDSKFAWDSFEIMKSIKNGRVEIKKLTPVKAYLLAKRIQFLDIEKVWKQNVLF